MAIAEHVSQKFRDLGFPVKTLHRDMGRD
ncbi:hypothetical protein [Aerococcus urinae]